MEPDPLDTRIRSLVARAVADSPRAPQLPRLDPVAAATRPRRVIWAAIGVAAAVVLTAAAVWRWGGHDRTVGPATTDAPATSGRTRWPNGVAVIVAGDTGVDRVSVVNGSPVIQRLVSGVAVARAFELQDGLLIYQPKDGNIRFRRPDGSSGTLVKRGTFLSLEDADEQSANLNMVRIVYRTESTTPDASFKLWMWFQPDEPRSVPPVGAWAQNYGRVSLLSTDKVMAQWGDDTGQTGAMTFDTAGNTVNIAGTENSRAVAGDGEGSYGVLAADGIFTVSGARDGIRTTVPDPTAVKDLDLRGVSLAVTYQGGTSLLIDLRTGVAAQVPAQGNAVSIDRATGNSDSPTPTTVALPPTSVATTTTAPAAVTVQAITTGPEGVLSVGGPGADRVLVPGTDPMAVAIYAAGDGSVIMQRRSGYGAWTDIDTIPLVWRNGVLSELFPTMSWAADSWVRIHDVATVNGHVVVLYEVQHTPNPMGPDAGTLYAAAVDGSSSIVVDPAFGGWEQSHSRMHLSNDGVVIGELLVDASRMFVSYRLDGTPGPTAADLGIGPGCGDCNNGPRLFTISRDGFYAAWLDGTTLVRANLSSPTPYDGLERVDLGQQVIAASDLDLGNDVVLIDRVRYDALAGNVADPPLAISLAQGSNPGTPLPGSSATLR